MTFFGGFGIAFYKGPLLASVLLCCIPLIVIAGGAMSMIMSKMAGRGQVAYAEAGNVVEQTVGAIRTVSFLFFFFFHITLFFTSDLITILFSGSSVYGRETSNGKIREEARDFLQDYGSTRFDLWSRSWYNASCDLL